MKGLNLLMKYYVKRIKILLVFSLLFSLLYATYVFSQSSQGLISAKLVKEKFVLDELVNSSTKIAPTDSDIESNQVVEVRYGENKSIYVVPIRSNATEKRGCAVYSFDKNKKLKQKLMLSEIEETESCEIIKAVFACNRQDMSGVAVLYGKRLGADNYWFEGTYLIVSNTGLLVEDKMLSNQLDDVDTVAKAKKKLKCR